MTRKLLNTLFLIFILLTGCKQTVNKTEPLNHKLIPILPCKQVEVIGTNKVKQKVIKDAIRFFLGTNCFINNLGIIRVFISKDDKGNEVWLMYSAINDRHMEESQVTPLFEDFFGDIVLVYDINYEVENKKLSEEEKQEIRVCMDQIIGNRVYQRPTRTDRWTDTSKRPEEFIGTTTPRGMSRESTGTSCKRKVVFYKDGTYSVLF
jgi:hypothetical protein